MKKGIIVIGIILALAIVKLLITNNYQLSTKDKEKLKEVTDGLLIEDFYVLLHDESEPNITYKSISMSLEDFDCSGEDIYTCKKDDTLLTIEETKSYLEQAKKNKIIKVNNLKNDIDLFGSIKDSMNQSRLLTSITTQISNEQLQLFAIKNIPINHSLDLISGDIDGYIMHPSSDTRIIYLTKENKTYKITLKDLDYFKKEKIQTFLNTIEIKG